MRSEPTPTVADHVIWTEVEGEILLMRLTDECLFSLNEVASHVWRELCRGRSLGEIGDAIEAAYGADRAVLDDDLRRLVQLLAERRLVVPPLDRPV